MPSSQAPHRVQARPATAADLPAVEGVARETWHATYNGAIAATDIERFLSANYTQEALERRLAALHGGFVVAEDRGDVIGFANCGQYREAEMELFAIYVLPAYQRRGAGSALWTEVERFARDAGASTFHLWVLATNDTATRFYASKGGVRTDTRSYPVGDAEIEEVRFVFSIPI